LKALFIGGTGLISTEVSMLALSSGVELYLLNRGTDMSLADRGAKYLQADARDRNQILRAIEGMRFDCVVDWICFTPGQAKQDFEVFSGRTKQFIFISSASAYQKPLAFYRITESTPLRNPYWQYSRDKIACEDYFTDRYCEDGFPVTIVRPSQTYAGGKIPVPISKAKTNWTYIQRILDGLPMVVHGDGRSLWTTTHSADFAVGFLGLMGNRQAIGHPFHITSDEALTWDSILCTIGDAVGKAPNIVHIASDRIVEVYPELCGPLLGDKAESVVFDNTKIKAYVPEYNCVIPLREGMARALALFERSPALRVVDPDYAPYIDRLIR